MFLLCNIIKNLFYGGLIHRVLLNVIFFFMLLHKIKQSPNASLCLELITSIKLNRFYDFSLPFCTQKLKKFLNPFFLNAKIEQFINVDCTTFRKLFVQIASIFLKFFFYVVFKLWNEFIIKLINICRTDFFIGKTFLPILLLGSFDFFLLRLLYFDFNLIPLTIL